MPSPQHDRTQDQLAPRVPRAAEAVVVPRHTHADPHTPVRRDALEDDVEDGEVDGVAFDLGGFDDGDEEDGQGDPPEIVR